MTRDKEETKARILAAVGKLLAASGFRQLGINAIAREAQVDKVLIYQYNITVSMIVCFKSQMRHYLTRKFVKEIRMSCVLCFDCDH